MNAVLRSSLRLGAGVLPFEVTYDEARSLTRSVEIFKLQSHTSVATEAARSAA
jgi:hypothetical protein